MKALYFSIIVLMLLFAAFFYEWGGVWIAEGVLAGIGLCVADRIHGRGKHKKDGA